MEKHANAENLFVEKIDIGEASARTIVSGLVKFMTKEELNGRRVVVVANMAPRPFRGIPSEGMVCTHTLSLLKIQHRHLTQTHVRARTRTHTH